MQGANTLWVPGTDHAGIATQLVVERQLDKQNLSRHELGRETFIEHVWAWKETSGSIITEQIKRLGASIDWSRTAVSDLEVVSAEEDGSLWHIRYPLADGSAYLTVATTRPETMLGDAALMVHPQDERYQAFIGKMVRLPLCEREIPVIADESVNGTNCH
ncbi:hypothetical protein CPC16_002936 [Podila verticillata]|nr:hypothetical protein CPC16_002936 [Podila verticillata]